MRSLSAHVLCCEEDKCSCGSVYIDRSYRTARVNTAMMFMNEKLMNAKLIVCELLGTSL